MKEQGIVGEGKAMTTAFSRSFHALNQLIPYRECRKFERCSVNVCPLDPDRELRTYCADDPETSCKLPLAEQREIAASYPSELLPWLTPKVAPSKKLASKNGQKTIVLEGTRPPRGSDRGDTE